MDVEITHIGMQLISRQRVLMRLLANEGGRIDKLRLVKLAFLLKETAEGAPKPSLYEFVPYHYGPYSFTLSHDLRVSERDGWVRISDGEIKLVRESEAETLKLDKSFSLQIDQLTRRYQQVSTSTLVSTVYGRFPWFTSRAKNESLRSVQAPLAPPAVFTVGYEGLMLEGLLDLLLRNGLRRLIDVRCNAVARRFGFHKSTLARHCQDVGISYTHIPALGIPSIERASLDDTKSYDKLFRRYEEEILPSQEDAVQSASLLVTKEPSAFMCMEAQAHSCHRSRLARVIARRTGLPIKELRDL